MKYGLFTYEKSKNNLINIGDYVQSLAAKQYLPKVDVLLERDAMDAYRGDPIKLIMNGWFAHTVQNWPPSDLIHPLIVSFHLNKKVADEMLGSEEIVNYFKKHAPIGCRDYDSMYRMRKAEIESFYSGCLTTTLNYDGFFFKKQPVRRNNILMADVLFKDDVMKRIKRNKLYIIKDIFNGKIFQLKKVKKYIEDLVPEAHKNEVEHLTCYYTADSSEDERFAHAEKILKELASTKVVVTSRIHIALPCLALNTPVLFVFGGQLTDLQEFRRLDGVINLMNVLVDDDFDTSATHLKGIKFFKKGDIDWNNPPRNPEEYLSIRKALIEKCEEFIN